MKGHHLGLLIVAALLAIVAAFWTTSVREPAGSLSAAGDALFPGLADTLNEVTGIKLTGPGNSVIATLERADTTWTLAEKHGHRASVGNLRELLLKLSQAKMLEEKTSNPEFYERLGVQDIEAADAGGVLVELDGVAAPAVIVGNRDVAREAVYVRFAGEAASWLASGDISVADETMQWLGRQALDINAGRIAEVLTTHPDGHTVRASKSAFGQANFDVADIPAGRELKRANIANAMGSVLTNLRIDDVMPLSESGFADLAATRAAFFAFDGLVINADVASKDDKYYAHFSAATDAATAARYLPVPAETAEEENAEQGPAPPPQADLSAVAAEAERLNGELDGWVYELPKAKYDQMSRRLEDLLKDQS